MHKSARRPRAGAFIAILMWATAVTTLFTALGGPGLFGSASALFGPTLVLAEPASTPTAPASTPTAPAFAPTKAASTPTKPSMGDLVIEVVGIRDREGQLAVSLFAKEDGWPKAENATIRKLAPITGSSMRVTLSGVTFGSYAIHTVQDSNMNGKMDMRWLPFPAPAEGAAMSNDARARMGPPAFKDALVQFSVPGTVYRMQMRY